MQQADTLTRADVTALARFLDWDGAFGGRAMFELAGAGSVVAAAVGAR